LAWDTEHYVQKRIELGAFLRDSPGGIALFHKSLAEWLSSSQSSPFYAAVDDGKKRSQISCGDISKNPDTTSPARVLLPINSMNGCPLSPIMLMLT
jgi:hypothetical protein